MKAHLTTVHRAAATDGMQAWGCRVGICGVKENLHAADDQRVTAFPVEYIGDSLGFVICANCTELFDLHTLAELNI